MENFHTTAQRQASQEQIATLVNSPRVQKFGVRNFAFVEKQAVGAMVPYRCPAFSFAAALDLEPGLLQSPTLGPIYLGFVLLYCII